MYWYEGWKRNAKENLYIRLGGRLLTVFPRGYGYHYCIRYHTGVRYSDDSYDTEEEAARAAVADTGSNTDIEEYQGP
jgi:hypothetical protein